MNESRDRGVAQPPDSPLKVGAVVVAFFPDESIFENLSALAAQCSNVVVVDNGSSPEIRTRLAQLTRVSHLPLTENVGVAAALNQGVRWAVGRGCAWCLTFDQDSFPQPGFVAGLLRTHHAFSSAGVVAPCISEAVPRAKGYKWMRKNAFFPLFFERVGCAGQDIASVTTAITSGSLIDLALWKRLGGFDEGLFIDGVDTDYCLRVARAGRRVVVSHEAVLTHRLGEREIRRFLGTEVRPTHHAAFRHYFMARNRMALWFRHGLTAPHWALFEAVFAGYNLTRVVLFEQERGLKLKAMVLGTWDGMQGRRGPCPPARRKVLGAK